MRRVWLAAVATAVLTGCPKQEPPPASKTPAPAKTEHETDEQKPVRPRPAVDASKAPLEPPAGLSWPVRLQPPPETMAGIPPEDQAGLRQLLGLMRLAAAAKTKMLNGLAARSKKMNRRVDLKAMRAAYDSETRQLELRLREAKLSPNLAPLRDQLAGALADQRAFFTRAEAEAAKGRNLKVIVEMIPEAARASQKLLTCYKLLGERYPKASKPVQETLKSHLKILDIL